MANELLFASSLDLLKESFLWAAAKGGNVQDCESLIEIGSDLNWRGAGGDTPLLAACRCGHSDTVAYLLARGADISAVGNDSYNALHIAADQNDLVTMSILLDAGLSMKVKTRTGQTAFDIAIQKDHGSICNRLMRTSRARNSSSVYEEPDAAPAVSSLIALNENISGKSCSKSLRSVAQPPFIGLSSSNHSFDMHEGGQLEIDSVSMRLSSLKVPPLPTLRGTRQGFLQNNTGDKNELKNDKRVEPLYHLQNNQNSSNNNSSIAGSNNITSCSSSNRNKGTHTYNNYSIISQNLSSSSSSSSGTSSSSSSSSSGNPTSTENPHDILISLRNLLEVEKKKRETSDNLLGEIKVKNEETIFELNCSVECAKSLQERFNVQVEVNNQLRGESSSIDVLDLVQIAELEKILRQSLQAVEVKKASLLTGQSEQQKEQRLCVICQTKEKSVVLLPCRHMCLCDDCADGRVECCPLCRMIIAHRISVYA